MKDLIAETIESCPHATDHPVWLLDGQAAEEEGPVLIETGEKSPDIRCTARLIGRVSTRRPGKQIWTELEVYQTQRNNIVAIEMGLGSEDWCEARTRVGVLRRLTDLPEFLGYKPLAMKLYSQFELDTIEVP